MGAKTHDQLVTVTVGGVPLGTFDTFSGGAQSRENTKHRPGGSTRQTVHGGLPSYDDVTVTRVPRVGDAARVNAWLKRTDPIPMSVSVTETNGGRVVPGTQRTYRGVVANINPGDYDSDGDDLRSVELQMTVEDVS